jgi:hypothetical protein
MPDIVDLDALTPDEAVSLLLRLEQKFGWACTAVTRLDADNMAQSMEIPNRPLVPLTDDEWSVVSGQRAWTRHVPEAAWLAAIDVAVDVVRTVLTDYHDRSTT